MTPEEIFGHLQIIMSDEPTFQSVVSKGQRTAFSCTFYGCLLVLNLHAVFEKMDCNRSGQLEPSELSEFMVNSLPQSCGQQ